MGTADQDDVEQDPTKGAPDHAGDGEGPVSDKGADSDADAATGEEQAAENRDRESPS